MPWTPSTTKGVDRKQLADERGATSYETSLVRLAAAAHLPAPPDGWGQEVVVLDGCWDLPEGSLETGGYTRRPPQQLGANTTATGCTLFVRSCPFADADDELVHSQTDEQPWLAGHGNLRVKPLHTFEGEGTALVHWPAGERFIPHQHWGGEEILVLSGTFMDEHGRYPQGTWLLSPHLSAHHPFVEQETVIFVKTGHLPAAAHSASNPS
jgi:hypothetical protein